MCDLPAARESCPDIPVGPERPLLTGLCQTKVTIINLFLISESIKQRVEEEKKKKTLFAHWASSGRRIRLTWGIPVGKTLSSLYYFSSLPYPLTLCFMLSIYPLSNENWSANLLFDPIWIQLHKPAYAWWWKGSPLQRAIAIVTGAMIDCPFPIKETVIESVIHCKEMVSCESSAPADIEWGLCALRHCIQISMEAILACHPARSTEWLDCHPKSCELWRIRTGPIIIARRTK